MALSYNPEHYTLNQIPYHRQEFIDLRVTQFINLFKLRPSDWPLDCTRLINKMQSTQIIPFQYGCFELSEKYDAITEYIPEHKVFLMQINKVKIRYPFENSRDRRLNFTLAHEIGHIVLRHQLLSNSVKTDLAKKIEEKEADEFAGRLLMPSKLIFTCNYYSIDSTAEYFNVSKTALWKRLNNMQRLDLLTSRKRPSCSQCGNTEFSSYAKYCSICGQPLKGNTNGIRRSFYPKEISMDKFKRMIKCPICGADTTKVQGDKCKCGTYIFNFCLSFFDDSADGCSYANIGNARFCEICGKPTYYNKKGFLLPWQEVLDYNAMVIAESEVAYL